MATEIVRGVEVHPKLLATVRLSCACGRAFFPTIVLYEPN